MKKISFYRLPHLKVTDCSGVITRGGLSSGTVTASGTKTYVSSRTKTV